MTASLHPGHGVTDAYQPIHYLIEPVHIGGCAVLALVTGLAISVIRARRSGRRRA
jgi:hypothetical protein